MKKIFLLLVLVTVFSCGNSNPDESDVKDIARAIIIHNLKDPSSAKFYHNEVITDNGDSSYVYTETVGATNSFGGVIAQNVIAKIKWNGGDPSEITNWGIGDIQFTER